jgi:tetratricopeptide (TPR) repeat protein
MPLLRYAEKPIGKSDQQMLKLMQGLSYYSNGQYTSIYNLISRYKLALGDYRGALKDMNEIMRQTSNSINNAYYLAFKATLFSYLHQFDSAGVYFDKSLKIDSLSVNILVNYGNALLETKGYTKAEELFKKAILAEPENYVPYTRLASLKMTQKEYALAKYYALKADNLFKDDVGNTIIIANMYGYLDFEKDSAEYFYNRAIGKDSLNVDALNALAAYYQRFFITDPICKQKIDQLLTKAKSLKAQNDLQTEYNFGMAAFGSGNYKVALQYFEKIYLQNKLDIGLLSGIAQSYYRTNQSEKALVFGKKALELDSLNPNNLIVYALLRKPSTNHVRVVNS